MWPWFWKWKTLALPIWRLELITNKIKQNYLKQHDLAPFILATFWCKFLVSVLLISGIRRALRWFHPEHIRGEAGKKRKVLSFVNANTPEYDSESTKWPNWKVSRTSCRSFAWPIFGRSNGINATRFQQRPKKLAPVLGYFSLGRCCEITCGCSSPAYQDKCGVEGDKEACVPFRAPSDLALIQ